jgi:hypothetical protein
MNERMNDASESADVAFFSVSKADVNQTEFYTQYKPVSFLLN